MVYTVTSSVFFSSVKGEKVTSIIESWKITWADVGYLTVFTYKDNVSKLAENYTFDIVPRPGNHHQGWK